MDLADIKRQQQAARQFGVKAGHATFTLTLPTEFEKRMAYLSAAAGKRLDTVAMLRVQRELVLSGVTGWDGVRVTDALPTFGGDEPFDFEPGAAEVLLDAQPEWEEILSSALLDRISSDTAKKDTAAKN